MLVAAFLFKQHAWGQFTAVYIVFLNCILQCSCGPMMLDVLFKIKDDQDHSLAFRRSCRYAVHICPHAAYLLVHRGILLAYLKVYKNFLALAKSQTTAQALGTRAQV